jgi:hypothetical protein
LKIFLPSSVLFRPSSRLRSHRTFSKSSIFSVSFGKVLVNVNIINILTLVICKDLTSNNLYSKYIFVHLISF